MRLTSLAAFVMVLVSATASAEPILLGDLNAEPVPRHVRDVEAVGDGFVFLVVGDGGMETRVELWSFEGPGTEATRISSRGNNEFEDVLLATGRFALFQNLSDDGEASDHVVWVTDGTAAGTVPTGVEGEPARPVGIGSRVVFWVTHGDDEGLWASDGTAEGTELLSPTVDGIPQLLVRDGRGYFVGSRCNVWETDATASGTAELVRPTDAGQNQSCALGEASGHLVLAAHDGGPAWLVDGTSATRADFLAGGRYFTDAGTFGAFVRDRQLWVTDNTDVGTVAVAATANLSSQPIYEDRRLPVVGGRVLFVSEDGSLWSSDGSMDGEEELISAAGGPFWEPVAAGGFIYLRKEEAGQLFRTDGTAAGTTIVADVSSEFGLNFAAGSAGVALRTPEGLAFVDPAGGDPVEVWQALDPDVTASSDIREMIRVGELAYFLATFYSVPEGGQSQPALYRTDGTPAGTTAIASGDYAFLGAVGDALLLRVGEPGEPDPEFAWLDPSSDAPTPLAHDLPPMGENTGSPHQVVHGGGETFLVRTDFDWDPDAEQLTIRYVIARVDRDGIETYADFRPELSEGGGTNGSVQVESKGVLAIRGPECVVWRVQPDGTVETTDESDCGTEDEGVALDDGTVLEFDDEGVWASSDGKRVRLLDEGAGWEPVVSLGAFVAFLVGGVQGLGVTDGTPEGTTRIEGVSEVRLDSSLAVRGRLVFVADDATGRPAVFSVDAAGSLEMLTSTEDGAVYPWTQNGGSLAVAGNHIIFSGFDSKTGVEPYAIAITWDAEADPPGGDTPGDGESGSADEGCGGAAGHSGSVPMGAGLLLVVLGLVIRRSRVGQGE